MKSRWEEYQTCLQRGHQGGGHVALSNPPKQICTHCGTYFWTTVEHHETGAPEKPE